ncbi:MAG: cyclic nucleotide-binding domain-containing protein [Deltaproteobacteria bacterium]|nr:cyclic nucleotide-binding domain-containing protein [Deltaproteobacteria bacterium]
MSADEQLLSTMDLFAELESQELEKVAVLLHAMKVSEGEILTQRGEAAHTFYIILSGNYMMSFQAGRAVTLHHRGEIMGWSTVVTPFEYTGTGVALTDGEVLCMPGADFQELLQADAVVSEKIMKKINEIVAERRIYITGPPK